MSTRSIRRNHRRELARAGRRRAAVVAGTAASASLLLASGAHAATFTVNQTTDAGDGTCDATCTLRDAIDDAEANPDQDTIDFAGLTSPATISLAGDPLDITRPVAITGLGADALTIEQNPPATGTDHRVFDIGTELGDPNPRPEVSITGTTITGGRAGYLDNYTPVTRPGGGIRNLRTDLTLDDVVITGNEAVGEGGGLLSYLGSLSVTDSVISGNTAGTGAAGAKVGEQASGAEVEISDTEISGNTLYCSVNPCRAGGIAMVGGEIEDSTISGNYAPGAYAGGLDLIAGATATDVTVADNRSGSNGGGVAMSGSGSLLSSSTVSDNFTYRGGGGVFVESSGNSILDTTISGNEASLGGGGINVEGDLTMRRSTVADNDAGLEGGGVLVGNLFPNQPGGSLTMSSSILADNDASSGNDSDDLGATEPSSEISASFSLIEGEIAPDVDFGSEAAASNILGIDPQLGPLADNGGPTLTQLPATTSAVIDAGLAGSATTDQRGEDRPVDTAAADRALSDGADMGAVELQDVSAPGDSDAVPPETAITSGPSGSGNPASVSFAFNSPDATATFECSLDGAAFAACTSPRTLSGLADGAHVFQVRAVDPAGNLDATPATRTFVVGTSGGGGGGGPTSDTRAPETAITSVPAKLQAKGKKPAAAKLEFIGIDDVTDASALTFECKLDAAGYVPCSSPSSLKVKKGTHTFSVRAKDAAGNVDASAATATFKVKVKKAKKKK